MVSLCSFFFLLAITLLSGRQCCPTTLNLGLGYMDFYRFLWISTDFCGFFFGRRVPKNPKYGLEKNQYIPTA